MSDRITVRECIGCGRIEGAQPCIGVCQDRRAEFVRAADHDAALAELAGALTRIDALAALLRQIAFTSPRTGECERAWSAFQARARAVVAEQGA